MIYVKKKIFTAVSVILVISLLAPSLAFANDRPAQNNPPKPPMQAIQDHQANVTAEAKELMDLRSQIRNLVNEISTIMRGFGGYKELVNDPAFSEIKADMEAIKVLMKSADMKANIKGRVEDFKKLRDSSSLAEAKTQIEAILADQQAKVDALNAIITKLNATLDKAKAFADTNKDKVISYSAIKEEYKALTKTIQANHLSIVKLNSEIRDLINKIVATVSANKDSFTDEQKASLNTILTDLKTVKDGLKSALKAGEVKTAIENANKLRKEGKFEEAKAQLEIAISVQNERKTALTDAKTKIAKVLSDINDLVASSTTSSEPVSSDVTSAA